MRKSKQFKYAVFCFAFLFAKSSFANIPAFDPMSYIPDIKQFKELATDLRNTKEQLNQIRQDLRAMGDSVKSVASYSQKVIHTVKRGAEAVSSVVDKVNETLGTDIQIGEGLNNVIASAENVQKDLINNSVDRVAGVLNGEDIPVIDDIKEKMPTIPNLPSVPNLPDFPLTEDKPDTDTPKIKMPDTPAAIKIPSIEKPKELTMPTAPSLTYEEEEEEEEVGKEEIIAELKTYFTSIQDENKKIANRLNDVLDMHINRLNTSAEKAEKSFAMLEANLDGNSNFSAKERTDFINRIVDLKARHQKVYDWNIILAEKVKENYNKEFKNKILDNLSNYEKVTVAYLNGSATLKEVNTVGMQVKNDARAMSIVTDKKVMAQIKKEAAKLRKDLIALSSDIKKIEDKNKSKTKS